jgi:hypothetical protein
VTTDQRMLWASIGGMVIGLLGMVIAHLLDHVWWGVALAVAIALGSNFAVRCPRCGANVFRQESAALGTIYSITNTSCYRCGLSFTRRYVASEDHSVSQWVTAAPWWRRSPATLDHGSVALWARMFLVIVAVGIGYLNMRAVGDPSVTWGVLTLQAVLLGCAYLVLVVLTRKLLSVLGSRNQ